jgi:hypothetical protein
VFSGPSVLFPRAEDKMLNWRMHKGLMRSLQKTGCSHVLDIYCEGLIHQTGCLQQDAEFVDIQVSIASFTCIAKCMSSLSHVLIIYIVVRSCLEGRKLGFLLFHPIFITLFSPHPKLLSFQRKSTQVHHFF